MGLRLDRKFYEHRITVSIVDISFHTDYLYNFFLLLAIEGGTFRTSPNFYDKSFCENSEQLKVVNSVCKKGSVRNVWQGLKYAFDRSKNVHLLKNLIIQS